MIPTEQRINKFKSIIAKKQFDLGIVLENVHNPHNIGAVIRSCDAVGILDVYLIYSTKRTDQKVFEKGRKSARGADKWMNIHFFESSVDCMKVVREKYKTVYATQFSSDAKSLYDLQMENSIALVFGNEMDGVSDEMMQFVDSNFLIPQEGMAQSLNISVACALSLYEARRQRAKNGNYSNSFDSNNKQHTKLLEQYIHTHSLQYNKHNK